MRLSLYLNFLANTEETDNPEIILKVINSKNYEIYNDDDELLLKAVLVTYLKSRE